MAGLREHPYVQFNFLIDFGAGGPGPHGGFQECSSIGTDQTVAKYDRAGEKPVNVQKITGINKSTDVTLKRGVVSARAFEEWLEQSRGGRPSHYYHHASGRAARDGANLEAAASADHQAR
jgi:phage tail-like protein